MADHKIFIVTAQSASDYLKSFTEALNNGYRIISAVNTHAAVTNHTVYYSTVQYVLRKD